MSYDHWKTTNPDDEWLGPDPREQQAEEDYWRMVAEDRQHSGLAAAEIQYESELRARKSIK